MDDYNDPIEYYDFISSKGSNIDEIYLAMQNENWGELAIKTLEILEKLDAIPEVHGEGKSEELSLQERTDGNESYRNGDYFTALEEYNKALAFAPENSLSMMLAYSNRSALFMKIKAYTACLKDIETCLAMKCCTYDIANKLNLRKKECVSGRQKEDLRNIMINTSLQFSKSFFSLGTKRHPILPNVSSDVEITRCKDKIEIKAARNIPVGTLISIEPPFVSQISGANVMYSCYYCLRFYLNLIPCKGCSEALFCSSDCMKQCMDEYHYIECKLFDVLETIEAQIILRLTLKAVLKLKSMCTSWDEFIEVSKTTGNQRMVNSTLEEIFNNDNKLSILNFNDNQHLVHGKMFNASQLVAILLNSLKKNPSFLPKAFHKKELALQALGNVMMNINVFYPHRVELTNTVYDIPNFEIPDVNHGWYSFGSKIKHACDANLTHVCVKNKLALIAQKPIQKGEKLTLSYIGHWYDNMEQNSKCRASKILGRTQKVCSCHVCLGKWDQQLYLENASLTDTQRTAYRKWCITISKRSQSKKSDESVFKETCKLLTILKDKANTKEHCEALREFHNMLNLFDYATTGTHEL